MIRLALDAMGGDFGPEVTVVAAIAALQRYPDLSLTLVGDRDAILRVCEANRCDDIRLAVHHAPQKVEMDERPSSALRNKRQLIDKLKGADNPQIAQQQQEAAQLGKAKAEADIRATNAKANKDEVSAAVDLTSAAREAMAPPEQTASVQ